MTNSIFYKRLSGSSIQGDATQVTEPQGTVVIANDGSLRLHDGSTAGGNPVVSNASTSSLISGSYTVSLDSGTGVLTVPGFMNLTYGQGGADTMNFGTGPGGGSVNATAGNSIYVTTNGGSGQWVFGADGSLTLPLGGFITAPSTMGNNTVIKAPASNQSVIENNSGNNFISVDDNGIAMTTVRGNVQFGYNLEAPGVPTHFHINKADQTFDLFFGDDANYFHLPVTGGSPIIGANGGSGQQLWTFGQDGSTTFPNDTILGTGSDPNVYIETVANGTTSTWTFGTNGVLTLPAATPVIQGNGTGTNVTILATTGTNTATWVFGAIGTLTFPDTSVQTTAYTANTPPALVGLLSTATTIAITAATAQDGPSANIDVTITNHQVDHYGSTAYTGNILSTGLVVIPDTTQSPPIAGTILQVGSQSLTQSYSLGANGSPADSYYVAYAYVVTAFGTVWSAPTSGQFGSVCLIAGTMILLSDGTRKAIEDITYTDKLQSWNFDQGCYAETTALWIKQAETGYQYNLLTFSDGTTLRTFDQHRIFNKEAGAFTYPMTDSTPIGTTTVNEYGQEITLVDKQVIQDTIEYYNVITDYHMNLFSDTILTSCRFNNIYPITDMKFVKDGRTPRTRDEFADIPDRFFYGLRLAEQTTDIETVEWYVTRLLALEESFEAMAV